MNRAFTVSARDSSAIEAALRLAAEQYGRDEMTTRDAARKGTPEQRPGLNSLAEQFAAQQRHALRLADTFGD